VTTLIDDALRGQATPWVGGVLYVTHGPTAREERAVVGFDAERGIVTVASPFDRPVGAGTEYVLYRPTDGAVPLPAGTEISVGRDQPLEARRVRRTFPRIFAGGEEQPWFREIVHRLDVFPGSPEAYRRLQDDWPLPDFCIISGPEECVLPSEGEAEVRVGVASVMSRSASPASGPRLALGPGASPGTATVPVRGNSNVVWKLDSYAIGAEPGETLGSRARLNAVHRRLFAEVGGHYGRFRGRDDPDLSEMALLYRFGEGGDLKIGRQHLFLGPVNNSRLGTLLGSSTIDAAIWSTRTNRPFTARLGYIRDSTPLHGEGFSGWLGRAQGQVGGGLWGVTLLTAHRSGGGFGGSADLSIPLVLHELDGYLEAGRDPFERDLFTGGLHFSGLHQRTGLDLFLEYQSRTTLNDRVSVNLRAMLARHWDVFGYFIQELNGGTSGGVALRRRWDWR
jgi:hypothetical protein